MPSITIPVSNLQALGPLMDVALVIDEQIEQMLRQTKQPLPAPVRTIAMVDTGASISVVKQGLLSMLGISPTGVVPVSGVSSSGVPCYEYSVRLLLPQQGIVPVNVVEAPLNGQNIGMLIGRDVLQHAVLVYIGYANQFTLSF